MMKSKWIGGDIRDRKTREALLNQTGYMLGSVSSTIGEWDILINTESNLVELGTKAAESFLEFSSKLKSLN